jgi:hypothetical protein
MTRTPTPRRCAVHDVVNRQIDVGIDIVDDGEMGKASWITYLYEPVSGLEARVMTLEGASMMPPSRDRQQFPGAYAALDALDEAAVRESNRAADSSGREDEPAAGRFAAVYNVRYNTHPSTTLRRAGAVKMPGADQRLPLS